MAAASDTSARWRLAGWAVKIALALTALNALFLGFTWLFTWDLAATGGPILYVVVWGTLPGGFQLTMLAAILAASGYLVRWRASGTAARRWAVTAVVLAAFAAAGWLGWLLWFDWKY